MTMISRQGHDMCNGTSDRSVGFSRPARPSHVPKGDSLC
ncbi:hypothetical protein P3T35_007187 [Kitasatospora sp. GP30]|nr:hypothetical protein [Kitasatospora sp. GP30]